MKPPKRRLFFLLLSLHSLLSSADTSSQTLIPNACYPLPVKPLFSTASLHPWSLHPCPKTSTHINPLHVLKLISWLLLLFYLLGTTASDYFSCTLEKLSDVLKLSPAVAGVTLLAVGNGAPDVFSSVAAFVSSDRAASIGFSCVLGGALFITTIVSGTVSLVVSARSIKSGSVKIDLVCFVRDALFLLASAGVLTLILIDGKVFLWEAIVFLGFYGVYAVVVWTVEVIQTRQARRFSTESTLLETFLAKGDLVSSLPQWSHSPTHLHLHHLVHQELETEDQPSSKLKQYTLLFYKYAIELPLGLPRRLTIPIIEEERWSRPMAVMSCALAPLFVAGAWILDYSDSTKSRWIAASIGGGLAVILALLAFFNTENSRPPRRFVWLWLTVGFLMSLVWFYLIADEVVATLESLGTTFGIDPAILGLTLLAWGNSVGDLVADLALACSGRDGVQIAISGCYAGPLFNVVVGLGISMVVACSISNPEPLLIGDGKSLFYMIAFLAAGLAWALVMMPLKGMRLSRCFGAGLVLLYCSFLVTGMCYTMGWISK